MRNVHRLVLFALALLVTLLNCVKPLVADDPVYAAYARQIAWHPCDPYGFLLSGVVPANHVLAPPAQLYWLSVPVRLFGEQPFLWKLWLLPYSLLFIFALHALFRRYAPGLEMMLTGMTVLSPTFLPGLNLMLDIPALALSLSALVLFLRAGDRDSATLAMLAGLVAGLSMETKYTGFVAPAVILLHAMFFRKLRLGLLAAILAVLVFVSCEALIAWKYGESHFLYSLQQQQLHNSVMKKFRLVLPFLTILGGLTPALSLLGLTSLGVSRRHVVTIGGLMGLGYFLLACVPDSWAYGLWDQSRGKAWITLSQLFFGGSGVLLCSTLALVAFRLLGQPQRLSRMSLAATHRVELFLLMWLAVEVAGSFALSPFPASRRVMGVIVVLTVLIGRLASFACQTPARFTLVRAVAMAGVCLGLGFYGVDVHDAYLEKWSAQSAARWIRSRHSDATIWYFGGWGFAYHAEKSGMKLLPPFGSFLLGPGDWLVVDQRVSCPYLDEITPSIELLTRLNAGDSFPLHTSLCYYTGGTVLKHWSNSHQFIDIYRRCETSKYGPP